MELTHPERIETLGVGQMVCSLSDAEFREFIVSIARAENGSTTWATMALVRSWAKSGRNIFVLGEDLTEMLEDTDISDAPVESLKLPYDCIYVSLPHCSYVTHSGTNGWLPVRGIYLCQNNMAITPELGTAILVGIWGPGGRLGIGDDAMSWKVVNMNPTHLHEKDGVSYVSFQKQTRDAVEARPWVEAPSSATGQIDLSPVDVIKMGDMMVSVVSLAVNLLLYLSSVSDAVLVRDGEAIRRKELSEAKRRTGKKRDAAIARATKLSAAKIFYLGKALEGESTRGSAMSPHMRRGHWHHYWTGSRIGGDGLPRAGEKIIRKWIKPVCVGTGDRKAGPRVYVAGA